MESIGQPDSFRLGHLRSPDFSIVVPTFNRADTVSRAIHSVLGQAHKNYELIIVDDGSVDGTKEIVGAIRDDRIVYIHQENEGRSAARNAGAFASRGKYLTFLDSDDEALPDWLSSFHEAFTKESGAGIVCSGMKIVESSMEQEIRLPRKLGPVYESQTGLFLSGTFAVRRDLFQATGGYRKYLAYAENSDLALRLIPWILSRKLKIVSVPRPLVIYHREAFRWARGMHHFRLRLETAKYFIEEHGEKYRKKHPRGLSNHFAIAGVSSARLDNYQDARTYFRSAIQAYPWNWRNYGRWTMSHFPFFARKLWLRFNQIENGF